MMDSLLPYIHAELHVSHHIKIACRKIQILNEYEIILTWAVYDCTVTKGQLFFGEWFRHVPNFGTR